MDKKRLKIFSVVGARPNFMKIAPIFRDIKRRALEERIENILVHTGQHYDEKMSKVFFCELDIPKPDINLEVGSAPRDEQVKEIRRRFKDFCLEDRPDVILVVGDVNSTVACALVGEELKIPIVHVEAGLRSFDMDMPEERNRIETDSLSDLLFTTCDDANINLKKEGVSEDKIFMVGNIMIDSLYHSLRKSENSTIRCSLGLENVPYALLTLHRPSNVDHEEVFSRILEGLVDISSKIKVVFPIHPRSRQRIEALPVYEKVISSSNILMVDPVGYLDFLSLMKNASVVLSDSGGIQEETTVLGVPCITLRENTERPVTITEGTNVLAGREMNAVSLYVDEVIAGKWKKGSIPEKWDGHAAERIIDILIERYAQ